MTNRIAPSLSAAGIRDSYKPDTICAVGLQIVFCPLFIFTNP